MVNVLTREAWPDALVASVLEAADLVAKNFHDDGVLLHVLMGDVTRFVEAAYAAGDLPLVSRCLNFLDVSLRHGDADVQNAVSVSFVENVGPWDAAKAAFIATWPDALRQDAEHFR